MTEPKALGSAPKHCTKGLCVLLDEHPGDCRKAAPAVTDLVKLRDEFLALEDGWNGHGGTAPTDAAIGHAMTVSFIPTNSGGVGIEWSGWGGDFSVEWNHKGEFVGGCIEVRRG